MPTATRISGSSGWEQFDGSVLIFLIWWVVSITLLTAGGRMHRPWMTIIGLASLSGLPGAIGGILVGLVIAGTHLGSNYFAFELGTICAGIGWVAGAMLGFYFTRGARPPSRGEAWFLRVAAAFFVFAAVVVARSIIGPAFFQVGEGLVQLDPSSISSLRWLILLDGAVAAAICLVLSVRTSDRQDPR